MSANAKHLFQQLPDEVSSEITNGQANGVTDTSWPPTEHQYVVSGPTDEDDNNTDEKYFAAQKNINDDNTRKKLQENAAWWASLLTSLKLGFLVSLFDFFRTSGLKQTFQTTAVHYAMLPVAVAFESIEVITDIIQIIAAKKSTPKQWISLAVNVLRLTGVGLAVGLILSGLAATGALFATIAGAAFVFAVGVKTLWHLGSAIYSGVKSLDPKLNPDQRSDLRHDALNHTIGAGIAGALAVCIGFVMLKASFLFAAIGMGVSGFGAIAGLGIMAKDYYRKKKAEKDQMNIAKSAVDDPLLSQNYPQAPSPQYDPRYQSSYNPPESPLLNKNEWRIFNPISSLVRYASKLSIFNCCSTRDKDAQYKKDDGDQINNGNANINPTPPPPSPYKW